MKNFINRAWASPEHKYRAVDKNGDLYYFDSRPHKTSYGRWLTIPTDFSIFCAGKYTGEIKWEKSLETKREYDKRRLCETCNKNYNCTIVRMWGLGQVNICEGYHETLY